MPALGSKVWARWAVSRTRRDTGEMGRHSSSQCVGGDRSRHGLQSLQHVAVRLPGRPRHAKLAGAVDGHVHRAVRRPYGLSLRGRCSCGELGVQQPAVARERTAAPVVGMQNLRGHRGGDSQQAGSRPTCVDEQVR